MGKCPGGLVSADPKIWIGVKTSLEKGIMHTEMKDWQWVTALDVGYFNIDIRASIYG